MKEYSIIVPTCGSQDSIKLCIESIIKYTLLDNCELIIVANGCNNEIIQYLKLLNLDCLKLLEYENRIGYTKAINIGLKESCGNYIILLNDDITLMPQLRNHWLDRLVEPFKKEENIGITGIHTLPSPIENEDFLLFWCVIISKDCLEKVGYLDERFNPGYGEDMDYCIRCRKYGFKTKMVCDHKLDPEKKIHVGNFPIYHKAEGTVHEVLSNSWDEIKDRNIKYLKEKYNKELKNIQNIGLLCTRNEEDIIEEVMNEHIKYFDIIYALDGSIDKTEEILRSYNQVKKIIKDSELPSKYQPIRDGARQILIEEVQKDYPIKGWFTLLHGDEIFFDNPNIVIEEADREKSEYILWETYNFFFHKNQIPSYYDDLDKPIKERLKWCNPGWLEIRQFVNKCGIFYDISQHSRVLPYGINESKYYSKHPRYNHYGFRSIEQIKNKAKDREETKWNTTFLPFLGQNELEKYFFNSMKDIKDFNGNEIHSGVSNTVLYFDNNEFIEYRQEQPRISISIITCTCDLLKRSLESVLKYTRIDTEFPVIEINIISNACKDEVEKYLQNIQCNIPINIIKIDKLVGPGEAYNTAIKNSSYEYLVLLNDDIVLLNQSINQWLKYLYEPFKKYPKGIGLTGPNLHRESFINEDFIESFCIMIPDYIIENVGMLDTQFDKFSGYYNDLDWCIRIQNAGYKIIQVPKEESNIWDSKNRVNIGDFPIWHPGGSTANRSAYNLKEGGKEIIKKYGKERISKREIDLSPLIENLKLLNVKIIVEIGCLYGESTEAFAKNFEKVYAVDSWKKGYDPNDISSNEDMEYVKKEFDIVMSKYNNVEVLHMTSKEASKLFKDGSLDFVYIDANHQYEFVKEDIKMWVPKIKEGFCIGGHDYGTGWEGVTKSVNEIFGNPNFMYSDSSWICSLKERKSNIENLQTQIKRYNVIPFFNELDLLEIRLNELYDIVDKFIISECELTHSGNKKPLYFEENKERFKKFENKIDHLIINEYDMNSLAGNYGWNRENSQRDFALKYVIEKYIKDDDIIILTDADEIPRKEAILQFNPEDGICCLEMNQYFYFLNGIGYKDYKTFNLAKIYAYKYSKDINGPTNKVIREKGSHIGYDIRYYNEYVNKDAKIIKNAGWHFTFLGKEKEIINKLESYAHQEHNKEENKNKDYLSNCINNGIHVINKKKCCDYLPIEYCDLPKYVRNNIQKYINLGYIKENKENIHTKEKEIEFSIVIPATYNHLEDYLKPCISSILDYTEFSKDNIEVIIIANDCDDRAKDYIISLGPPFKLIISNKDLLDKDIFNIGIKQSIGKYIILLNDNIILLPQYKNQWINLLNEPFKDNVFCGITGTHFTKEEWGNYVLFLCCMVSREVFDEVGVLDDEFNLKDLEFCYRAERSGFLILGIENSIIKCNQDYKFNIWNNSEDLVLKFEEKYGFNLKEVPKYFFNYSSFNTPDQARWRKIYTNDFIEYIPKSSRGKIVEIGCYLGHLTNILVKNFENVTTVDPWIGGYATEDGCSHYLENFHEIVKKEFLAKLSHHKNLKILELSSELGCKEIKDESLDVVYIDGDHKFLPVIKDLKSWVPKVKPDGYIAGHDYSWETESKALKEFFGREPDKIFKDDSWIYKKSNVNLDLSKLEGLGKVHYTGQDVSATVSTKDRYFRTLPLLIQSICFQTVKPKFVYIYDDGEHKDLRLDSMYTSLFKMLEDNKIGWYVNFGDREGQVKNHIRALNDCQTDLIWRLDDDNSPEPNVLEKLLETINSDSNIAGVASLVIDPKWFDYNYYPRLLSGKIEDIYLGLNPQWFKHPDKEIKDVDHLYSSFLFKRKVGIECGGYPTNLSKKGHREETIFTYQMKKRGYRLLINPNIITWHLSDSTGGIRSVEGDVAKDEQIFSQFLNESNVKPIDYAFAILDNGLGDHWAFKHIIEEFKEKNKKAKVVIACCCPDVFWDIEGIQLVPIVEVKNIFGGLERFSVYRWCMEHQWKGNLVEAFREMYINGKM